MFCRPVPGEEAEMRRRDFFALSGLAALTAALPGKAGAMPVNRVRPNPDAVAVLHDSSLCIGCRKCEAACQRVNADVLPVPERPFSDLSVLEEKRRTDFRSYTVVNKYAQGKGAQPVFRKQQCNHCLEPACVSACLVKALIKTPEGPVIYKPDLCLGCRYCMVACPYYVPAFDYNNAANPLIYKCTLCSPRLEQGLLPGCVEGCPTGALVFGTRKRLLHLAHERIAANPGRYADHIYGETEMGGTSWLYLSPVPHAALGQQELGVRPAPDMTAGMTGSAVMLMGLWPALLGGMYAIGKFMGKAAGRKLARAVSRTQKEDARRTAEALRSALSQTGSRRSAAVTADLEEAAMQQEAMEQGAASFRGNRDTDTAVSALNKADSGVASIKNGSATPDFRGFRQRGDSREQNSVDTDSGGTGTKKDAP